jgi:hypothetical protein
MKRTILLICLVTLVLASCRQEKRTVISLDGIWKIEEGSMAEIPPSFDHTVNVPGLVSLAVPAFVNAGPKVKNRNDIVQKDTLREAFWYYRKFTIEGSIPENAFLKISGAMFGARVLINGHDAGVHLPSFTPGYFDAREFIRKGENEIVIRIGASRDALEYRFPDGFDFEKERYIPGIFDHVELVLCGAPRISAVLTTPDIQKNQVRVRMKLNCSTVMPGSKISFVVKESATQKVAAEYEREVDLISDVSIVTVQLNIDDCRLWSPEDPFLYDLTVTTAGDEYTTRFGMREFSYDTISGRPVLNGKPYFLRGTNITLYRFFEDENCKDLPWNADWVRNLHKSFRQFNWNSVRYCIGLAPEEWYRIADEEGIMIQNEFPIWYGGKGWNKWPQNLNAGELATEFSEWVEEQWNHPSIIIWDASNETVSHDGKSEEVAAAIKDVRASHPSDRPWDNSYSAVREPGDVMELHPYHFQDPKYRLEYLATANPDPERPREPLPKGRRRRAGSMEAPSKYMKIVNEYGWLWLNRDGGPTTLTKDLYRNLLGKRSTVQQRRHLYAMYLAAETEFWRCHRKCAGVMHFTALGYSRSDGQTSDHFTDVARLQYEDEFMKYIPDAFSPTGLMLDEWGKQIKTGEYHPFRILAVNDLEKAWAGKITLELFIHDKLISGAENDFSIEAFGQNETTIFVRIPEEPGIYTVVASLIRGNEKAVRSIREIRIAAF